MSSTYTPAETWHPTITLPSDGDVVAVEGAGPPWEAALDNTAYLKANIGAPLINIYQAAAQGSGHGWGGVAIGVGYFLIVGTNPGPQIQISGITAAVGDMIEIVATVTFTRAATSSGGLAYARLEYVENYGVVTMSTPITTSQAILDEDGTFSLSLSGFYVATVAGPVVICVNGAVDTATTATDWHIATGSTLVKQYRTPS